LCGYNKEHPYHEALLVPPGNIRTVKNLEETRELWINIKAESEETLRKLNENVTKLRKASAENTEEEQIDIKIKLKDTTISAIIDCGANVDYVNQAWCEAQGFEIYEVGSGSMEGYDGRTTRMKLKETEIKFEFQGRLMKQKFRIIKETSKDLLVLGMPWLRKINPAIDWQKKTVELR
jgi:hypothetical protein